MRVGVIGLGRMGSAVAARLQEVGYTLTVWNRSADRAAALVDAGAILAASPRQLVEATDVVMSMLFDAAAVDAVFRQGDCVLSATTLTGKLFIEMSTVTPETHVRLSQEVAAKGGSYLEFPVGGTVQPARTGKLLGLAGGDMAALARARPILDQLCRRLEHIGPVGTASSMKLAINLPLVVFWQALGEALTLVGHLGRDPAWLIDLFADTSGAPATLKLRAPAVVAALQGTEPGAVTFDVDGVCKDLATMKEAAAARGIDLPLVSQTLQLFEQAREAGWGPRDVSALPAYWPSRSEG